MADPDGDLEVPDPRWAADLRERLLAAAQRQAGGAGHCERTGRPARPVPR